MSDEKYVSYLLLVTISDAVVGIMGANNSTETRLYISWFPAEGKLQKDLPDIVYSCTCEDIATVKSKWYPVP